LFFYDHVFIIELSVFSFLKSVFYHTLQCQNKTMTC